MKRFLPLLLLLGLACDGIAASPTFLLLDGIPGGSLEARHKGWIDVDNFSEGVSRAAPGAASAWPVFGPLSFTKQTDKATPPLVLACANGRKIKSGVLEVVKSGRNGLRFLQVNLTNVTVVSFRQSGGGDTVPKESLSLGFETVKWTYTEIGTNGKALRDIVCTWDLLNGIGTGGAAHLDSDDDGLPDDYERLYGLDLATPDSDGDLDGEWV